MTENAKVVPLKGAKCPLCGKRTEQKYKPFCSKRCADIDLGKWLNEDYRIASEDEANLEEDLPEEEL